jgi:hypothetical protein
MPLNFVHPVHRATHRIGLYLDKLGEPGLTQGEAHILAMLTEVWDLTDMDAVTRQITKGERH